MDFIYVSVTLLFFISVAGMIIACEKLGDKP